MFSVSRRHWPGLPGNKPLFRATLTCVALLTALLLSYGSHAAAQSDEDPLTRIETMLNTLAEDDIFSGSVLIARDGDILLSAGYGPANREWDIPNAPDTRFRIASITKQFTAMAILMLQERGLLTIENPICMYFENCPETWQDITVHNLLNHTSGIPTPNNDPDFGARPVSPRTMITSFIDLPLDFAPGEEWSYSNEGYVLLGEIIKEASGGSYQTFLRQNIFEPLGMVNSGYDSNLTVMPHRAEGYASSRQKATYLDMTIPYSAGALYSTVEDLYLWDQALYGGQIVSQATWDAMLTAAVPIPHVPGEPSYGYGLIIGQLENHPFVRHEGGIYGFVSSIAHFTDDNLTIIILSNLESAQPDFLVNTFAAILFGDD